MKTTQVTVHFEAGLHTRPAAGLVRLFKGFQSNVSFRLGSRMANASSILSILLLSARLNSQIEVQASGEDEDAALKAAEIFFQNDDEEMIQVRTPITSESQPRDSISSSDPS